MIGAALVEGATVMIGATLIERATLEIGVTLVEGETVKIGEWRTTMPSLLEPSSNSIDPTGIENQLR